MSASSMAVNTRNTLDYEAHTAFDYVKQNTAKNEIVSKFNAMLHLENGHNHDTVNSRSLAGGNYTIKDVEAMIVMGVYR